MPEQVALDIHVLVALKSDWLDHDHIHSVEVIGPD